MKSLLKNFYSRDVWLKSLETSDFISLVDVVGCSIYNSLLLVFNAYWLNFPWQDFHLFISGAQFAHDLCSPVQEIALPSMLVSSLQQWLLGVDILTLQLFSLMGSNLCLEVAQQNWAPVAYSGNSLHTYLSWAPLLPVLSGTISQINYWTVSPCLRVTFWGDPKTVNESKTLWTHSATVINVESVMCETGA